MPGLRNICVVACTIAMAVLPSAQGSAGAAGAHRARADAVCNHHAYFEALRASRHGEVVKVVGHRAKDECSPYQYYRTAKKRVTITLHASTVVKVYRDPAHDQKEKTIKPTALEHYLKHENQGQNIFRLYGSTTAPSKMVNAFRS